MAEGGVVRSGDKSSCTICLEDYKRPKLLPCFHTFCAMCLETFIEKHRRGNQFDCPLCRISIDVPGKGVDGFQANFYIETARRPLEERVIPCDLCGPKTQAVYRCTECEENMCSPCGSAHLRSKATRLHKVIELASVDSETSRKLVSRAFCTEHPQEEIKMFCKQCDSLLCMVCKMTEHENHTTTAIASEGKRMRGKLKSFLEGGRIAAQIRTLETRTKSKHEVKQRLQDLLDNGVKVVREQTKALHAVIDDIATDYENRLKKTYGDWQHEIQEILEQLERERQSLTACSDALKLIVEHDSDVEMLRNGKQLEIKMQELCAQKLSEERDIYPKKSFVQGNINKKGLEEMLGSFNIKKRNKSKILSPDKLRHIKSLRVDNYGDISGIAPVGNGKAWIGSYSSSKLKFIDIKSETIKTFELGGLGNNVTTNGNKEAIAVCLEQNIVKLVKLDSEPETIISNLDMTPHGVCCYTTDDGKEELLLTCTNTTDYYGTKGTFYRCDTKDYKSQAAQIEGCIAPIRIAVEPETGMFCTADWKNKVVTIHDLSGRLVAKYTDKNCGPSGVHFYDDQRIIVVNYSKDIRVIRVNGSFETVLKQIDCYSVAVDEEDHLWIGTRNDVQVFKIE